MADAQRGQFVIDCKSREAAGIIYGLVHDKTMFRPELDLANAHPKEFDNEYNFPTRHVHQQPLARLCELHTTKL